MFGFSSQDWESINTVNAEGRLVSLFTKPIDFWAKDGSHYRFMPFTDYASIPKAFWGAPLFLIPYGWYSLPCAGHDAAFKNTLLLVQTDDTTHLADLTEHESNDLALEMMQAIKPNPTAFEKAQMDAIFIGISVGGFHSFKADRA